tara:strand:- start:79 stop:255 length:177 start_codon:yes stop_codon:yes gene_type:complete
MAEITIKQFKEHYESYMKCVAHIEHFVHKYLNEDENVDDELGLEILEIIEKFGLSRGW